MKITLDTNFLISSTQWTYSVANKVLRKMIDKNVELYTTDEILAEFGNVLTRDFKHEKEYIEGLIGSIITYVKIVKPILKVDIVNEDPDDNKILECAVASHSDYILTYDKHLLNIKNYKEIKIITPEEALQLL